MNEKNKAAHLSLIQGIINRMGNNSFLIKGWSVTLVVALFALAVKDANKAFMSLALFSSILFWWLDGFILHQEKLFISLYNAIRSEHLAADFAMNTSLVSHQTPCLTKVMLSKTLLIFHGCITGLVIIALCEFR